MPDHKIYKKKREMFKNHDGCVEVLENKTYLIRNMRGYNL